MRLGNDLRETYEKIVKFRKMIELQCKGCTEDQANRRANIYAVKNTARYHARGYLHK